MALNSSAAKLETDEQTPANDDGDVNRKSLPAREDTLLVKYMRDVRNFSILTKEEEAALGQYTNFYGSQIEELEQDLEEKSLRPEAVQEAKKRMQELDAKMRPYINKFIVHNLRLVVTVAKGYQGRGLQLMDLIQEGNIGLERAAYKFDIGRGYRFSTYAVWWIRQSIVRAIADKGKDVRLPVYLHDRVDKLRHYFNDYHKEHGCGPSMEEICEYLKITPKQATTTLQLACEKYFSLDTPINGEDGGSSFANLLHNHDDVAADLAAIKKETEEKLEGILNAKLNPREQRIIRLRFGLDRRHKEELSLEEIGAILGVTRERIRQLQNQALDKLRKACRDKV